MLGFFLATLFIGYTSSLFLQPEFNSPVFHAVPDVPAGHVRLQELSFTRRAPAIDYTRIMVADAPMALSKFSFVVHNGADGSLLETSINTRPMFVRFMEKVGFLLSDSRGNATIFRPTAQTQLLDDIVAGRITRKEIEIVVCRSVEDVAWLGPLAPLSTVYNKGKPLSDSPALVIDLPNVGREQQTYFHHIVSRFDSLAAHTIFVHGREPSFGFVLRGTNIRGGHLNSNQSFFDYVISAAKGQALDLTVNVRMDTTLHHSNWRTTFLLDPINVNAPLSRFPSMKNDDVWAGSSDEYGFRSMLERLRHEQNGHESFQMFYKRHLSRDAPSYVYFAQGAQFQASAEALKRHAKEFYSTIMEELSRFNNPYQIYYTEMLWFEILDGHVPESSKAAEKLTIKFSAQATTSYGYTSSTCSTDGSDSYYVETISGSVRTISSTNCPNYMAVDINPNSASKKAYTYNIPASPVIATSTTTLQTRGGSVGVTFNGISVYSCFAGGSTACSSWTGSAVYLEGKTFDWCGGHADVSGEYHYHMSVACVESQLGANTDGSSKQVGWSFDGFPIYGTYAPGKKLWMQCGTTGADATYCVDSCGGFSGVYAHDKFLYRYFLMGPLGNLSTNPYDTASTSSSYFPHAPNCYKGCCPVGQTCPSAVPVCSGTTTSGVATGYTATVGKSWTSGKVTAFGIPDCLVYPSTYTGVKTRECVTTLTTTQYSQTLQTTYGISNTTDVATLSQSSAQTLVSNIITASASGNSGILSTDLKTQAMLSASNLPKDADGTNAVISRQGGTKVRVSSVGTGVAAAVMDVESSAMLTVTTSTGAVSAFTSDVVSFTRFDSSGNVVSDSTVTFDLEHTSTYVDVLRMSHGSTTAMSVTTEGGSIVSCTSCPNTGKYWSTVTSKKTSSFVGVAATAPVVTESCKTTTGATCVFPFLYGGNWYQNCTNADYTDYWCATAVDATFTYTSWGTCASTGCSYQSAAVATTCADGVKNGDETGTDCGGSCTACASSSTCTLSGGVATTGTQCVFPFIYKGVTHTSCTKADDTKAWCATKVSSSGAFITGQYAYCGSGCKTEATCASTCKYNGVTIQGCTTLQSTVPWCCTETDSSGSYVSGKWRYCTAGTDPVRTTTGSTCTSSCTYNGATFNGCTTKDSTKAWCCTQTTSAGAYNGKWGYCA